MLKWKKVEEKRSHIKYQMFFFKINSKNYEGKVAAETEKFLNRYFFLY